MENRPKTNGITLVTTQQERQEFLNFPYRHYEQDDHWIPPLLMEQKKLINREKNPFYNNAEIELFLAEQNGQVCGRIAAIIDHRYNRYHNTKTGFFGFFEAINDVSITHLLFKVVADWMNDRGITSVLGPTNPSLMDEIGILVEGFQHDPSLLMPYNKQYYDNLLKEAGLQKEIDLLAFRVFKETLARDRMNRAVELVRKRNPDIRIRTLNMKYIKKEVEIVRQIFNKAWADNWGFIPLTKEELAVAAKDFKMILDTDIAYVAEINNRPVAFSISLPDFNQALKHLDGTLFPTGIFKLLWHKRDINRLRTALMGVLPEYQGKGIDALFHRETIETAIGKGWSSAELSWVLETNVNMIRVAERIGAEVEKRYRMYRLDL